jgi:hypothetical protein
MRTQKTFLTIVFVILLSGTVVSPTAHGAHAISHTTYYVSRDGSNLDGKTWETAWSELDQIEWGRIRPGDTVLIDGGTARMAYETSLDIGQSGAPDIPITIRVSTEADHNGQVTLFGGRAEWLPYCGQLSYESPPDGTVRSFGIRTNGHDYLVIDGSQWRGMIIYGFGTSGMRVDAGSTHVVVSYLEISDNGSGVHDENGWRSDGPGVLFGGSDITFRRVIVHDNGQDAFQSLGRENNIANFRLEQSWLYNGRKHPTVNKSANYCSHTDGIQIYDGGQISGVTVVESVIGPGFSQGVILGQTMTVNGSQADVQNVTLRDVLFTRASESNILGYQDTQTHNWLVERVTAYCPDTQWHCLRIGNSDHTVVDSIVVGGLITFPDGLDSFAGNCIWDTSGFELGARIDPHFAYVSDTDLFFLDDFTVSPESPCQGSRITSVKALFELE